MTMKKIKGYLTTGFNWLAAMIGKSILVSFIILACLYAYLTYGNLGMELSLVADRGLILGASYLVWVGVLVTMLIHELDTTFTK